MLIENDLSLLTGESLSPKQGDRGVRGGVPSSGPSKIEPDRKEETLEVELSRPLREWKLVSTGDGLAGVDSSQAMGIHPSSSRNESVSEKSESVMILRGLISSSKNTLPGNTMSSAVKSLRGESVLMAGWYPFGRDFEDVEGVHLEKREIKVWKASRLKEGDLEWDFLVGPREEVEGRSGILDVCDGNGYDCIWEEVGRARVVVVVFINAHNNFGVIQFTAHLNARAALDKSHSQQQISKADITSSHIFPINFTTNKPYSPAHRQTPA